MVVVVVVLRHSGSTFESTDNLVIPTGIISLLKGAHPIDCLSNLIPFCWTGEGGGGVGVGVGIGSGSGGGVGGGVGAG